MNCRTVGLVFFAAIFAAINLSIDASPDNSLYKGSGRGPHPQSGRRRGPIPKVSRKPWTRRQEPGETAQSNGATTRRQRSSSANTQARGEQAKQAKDDLEDAMDDLNRSTNRLRRKFDPTSNYLETKAQMEQVMDSARRVNQVMVRGTTAPRQNDTGLHCARTSMSLRGATT
jgi:hypothetical protein